MTSAGLEKVLQKVVLAAAVAMTSLPARAQSCDAGALGPDADVLTSTVYSLAFRPDPAPVALTVPFSLDVFICQQPGAAPVDALRASATMLDQKPAAPVRPSVVARGGGHYRIDGYILNDPGRWQLSFEIQAGATTTRFATDIVLP